MVSELPTLRATFAIFHDLSKVAREEVDAFWLLGEIRSHGTKLESTLERVDDSPQGTFMFGIMASVHAFRSRGDAQKVRMGLERKFADGGTHGAARIGYLNTREMLNGKEVRSIATDPERVELVQLGFEAFATGEYSITTLREMLEQVGLRTRPTPKRPPKPLSRNGVYTMLRDDYYIGIVTRAGVKREGRHKAIIDPAVFEKVQHVGRAPALRGSHQEVRPLPQGLNLLRTLWRTADLRPSSRQMAGSMSTSAVLATRLVAQAAVPATWRSTPSNVPSSATTA